MSSRNSTSDPSPKSPAPGPDQNHVDEKAFDPRSAKFIAVMIGMYMSVFLVALVDPTFHHLHLSRPLTPPQDRTIIAVAIPAMTNDFHSISDIGWYGSAYLLTGACFNPIFGRIYQLYSTKWVFLTSVVIFEIGSAMCGAAPSSITFIIGRAIAGIGAAGIFQGGMMVIVGLVPLGKRPMFTALFGLSFGVCAILGPIVGGVFTDHV